MAARGGGPAAKRKSKKASAAADDDPPCIIRSRKNHPRETTCKVDGCGVAVVEKSVRLVRACPEHRRALLSVVNGQDCRFCQQCSRFHELARFDGDRRGCRKRLNFLTEKHRRLHGDAPHEDGALASARPSPGQSGQATDLQDHKRLKLEDSEISWGVFPDQLLEDDPFKAMGIESGGVDRGNGSVGLCDGSLVKKGHSINNTDSSGQHASWTCHEMTDSDEPAPGGQHCSSSHRCVGHFCQFCATDHFTRHCEPSSEQQWPGSFSAPSFNVSMKIHQATPMDLPWHLKDDLVSLCQIMPADMQGFIRPGCVHLSVDIAFASTSSCRQAESNLSTGLHRRSLWPSSLRGLFSGFDVDIALPSANLQIRSGDVVTVASRPTASCSIPTERISNESSGSKWPVPPGMGGIRRCPNPVMMDLARELISSIALSFKLLPVAFQQQPHRAGLREPKPAICYADSLLPLPSSWPHHAAQIALTG